MAWFRIRRDVQLPANSMQLRLGRYTDAYKSATQLRAWERAISYFSEGQYLKSFQHLLFYLHDPLEQNIHWVTDRDGHFSFELYQGSRRVSGQFGARDCEVRTTIGQGEGFTEALLAELLSANYRLRGCTFGLEEDGRLILRFRIPSAEADPHRLYGALRELALEADDSDDHLAAKHPCLSALREPHVREKTPEEIALRTAWFRRETGALLQWYRAGEDRHRAYPGGFSIVLLAALYKIEFLLSPQGQVRRAIAGVHQEYLTRRGADPGATLDHWVARLEGIGTLPDEELQQEFYDVTATFGQVETLAAGRLREILQGQVREMDSWTKGGFPDYARHIPGFIMGYCLYRYALPGILRDLFALYFLVTEPEWSGGLGFPVYTRRRGGYDRSLLVRTIQGLVQEWSDRFAIQDLRPEQLECGDDLAFRRSWLDMLGHAKFEER